MRLSLKDLWKQNLEIEDKSAMTLVNWDYLKIEHKEIIKQTKFY